jgi:TRAP-type C4-dicarboxylate transport system substrate-binding protein
LPAGRRDASVRAGKVVRHVCALAAALALVAVTGCSGSRHEPMRTLRLASADLAGVEHDPAIAFFVHRVATLSRGRLRIAVDERWAPGHEKQLLLDVARGHADLGWSHTSSFEEVGVRSFDALHAPMLVDGYAIERAVLSSSLATQMLAGTRSVGLRGLALLSGPLSRLVGVGQALRNPEDLRHLSFGVHGVITGKRHIPQTTAWLATRALSAFRVPLFHDFVDALYADPGGGASAFEDDLDTLFFDRDGGGCRADSPACRRLDPWVTANVVLWPRAAVLVANPRRLQALPADERAWIEQAASQAADYATTLGHRDEQRLVPELCAAGVRFATASRRDLTALRRVLRTVYARLERSRRTRSAIRRIERLRRTTAVDAALAVPPGCRRPGRPLRRARGVRSPIPDGVYRARITDGDLRRADAHRAGNRAGTVTLTLRDGRWRLLFSEPGRTLQSGTYAGTALRTTWAYDGRRRNESYVSVVVGPDGGLRFHVVRALDLPFARATYASHDFERIGR